MSLVINFLTGAQRTPTPLPSDAPAAGDGRFGNMLDDLWESEGQAAGFLGDASPMVDSDQRGLGPTVADVFNQHGLLARDKPSAGAETAPPPIPPANTPQLGPGGPTVAASEVVASEVSSAVAAPITNPSAPRPAVARPLTPAGATASGRQRFGVDSLMPPFGQIAVGSVNEQETANGAIPRANVRAQLVNPTKQATIPSPLVARELTEVPENLPDAGKTRNRNEAPETRASSEAQVNFGLDEQGANIAIRTIDGGQTERAKLRDRIAVLLSRYGLRAGELRLNGALLSNNPMPKEEEL